MSLMTGENKPAHASGRASARKIATTVAKAIGVACVLPTVYAWGVLHINLGEAMPASQVIPLLIGMAFYSLVGCSVGFAMDRLPSCKDGQGAIEPTTTPRGVDPVTDEIADAIANFKAIAVFITALALPATYIALVALTYPPAGVSTSEISAHLIGTAVFTAFGFLLASALAHRLFTSTEVKRVTPEERTS